MSKMTNFETMGLNPNILAALKELNFSTPTPIQEQAIPKALEGFDILGSAQTGTGKTAAFAIPMINHLLKNDISTSLILLPTRELAQQVLEAAQKILGGKTGLKSALLIGGDSMVKQLQQLKRNPRIIVGTPGRVNDHLSRRTLKLHNTDFLVLDETDRMLDMGFGIQLEEIAKFLPKERQTLMFSATMPKNIAALSRKYLSNPVRIAIGEVNKITSNIKQEIVNTSDSLKYKELTNQINIRNGSLLIFVKTKYGADRLAKKLSVEKFAADAIHGDLKQAKRERVISDFRKQKYRILVATDIAARGLDIPHIENVVNYDLPQCPEDYIHRIGRTARAGAEGLAINFLTPNDRTKWKEICKLINPTNRDKAMLTDAPAPIGAEAIAPALDNNGFDKRKTKARTSNTNPFNPFAPDKKKKSRAKFNKNTKSFGGVSESADFGKSKSSRFKNKKPRSPR